MGVLSKALEQATKRATASYGYSQQNERYVNALRNETEIVLLGR